MSLRSGMRLRIRRSCSSRSARRRRRRCRATRRLGIQYRPPRPSRPRNQSPSCSRSQSPSRSRSQSPSRSRSRCCSTCCRRRPNRRRSRRVHRYRRGRLRAGNTGTFRPMSTRPPRLARTRRMGSGRTLRRWTRPRTPSSNRWSRSSRSSRWIPLEPVDPLDHCSSTRCCCSGRLRSKNSLRRGRNQQLRRRHRRRSRRAPCRVARARFARNQPPGREDRSMAPCGIASLHPDGSDLLDATRLRAEHRTSVPRGVASARGVGVGSPGPCYGHHSPSWARAVAGATTRRLHERHPHRQ